MIEVLKKFNDLLNRPGSQRIGVIEGNADQSIDSAISGKLSVERFKESLEEAIKENMDYEDVSIISAESVDFGYKLEVIVSYVQDGEENKTTYYINHVILY